MPAGHNNPDINSRKPLTPGMESLLKWARGQHLADHLVDRVVLTYAEKNQLRALCDRGYMEQAGGSGGWKFQITTAGLERLAREE